MPIDVTIDEGRPTMLVLVQSRCRFCTESMPFYRSILELRSKGQCDVQVVAVGLDPMEITKSYLAENAVSADTVVPYPGVAEIRFGGTPTVLAIHPTRRILGVWEGRLTASQEAAVKTALGCGGTPAHP
ncbi:MAG: hypothetical protein Q7V01_06780 [Vicinamibacterales bacterium]|nr:hypothetical protein [Vicinamibacterales bacterium]